MRLLWLLIPALSGCLNVDSLPAAQPPDTGQRDARTTDGFEFDFRRNADIGITPDGRVLDAQIDPDGRTASDARIGPDMRIQLDAEMDASLRDALADGWQPDQTLRDMNAGDAQPIACMRDEDCAALDDSACRFLGAECAIAGFAVRGICRDNLCIEQPYRGNCSRDTDGNLCEDELGRCQNEQCARPPTVPLELACRGNVRLGVTCDDELIFEGRCVDAPAASVDCPRAKEVVACCSSNPNEQCSAPGVANRNVRLTVENSLQFPRCEGPDNGPWRLCFGRLYRPVTVRCEALE